MEILHLCPANIATGGTEGIHHLVSELNKCGANTKILYYGRNSDNPQPESYRHYNCSFITEWPQNFSGIVIFPEVVANKVVEPEYKNCLPVINWQGIDVYKWNTDPTQYNLFLQRKDTIHLTMSEYGMEHLKGLGLDPIKIPDCLEDIYYEPFDDVYERKDVVLYNPVEVKMTRFQKYVMDHCKQKFGIEFMPLQGYNQQELIDIFRHSKLYIDFGAFSGRERLPREAVLNGCCILTSKNGTAGYYKDNTIPDRYKLNNEDTAIGMIWYVLRNYEYCKQDFDKYRLALQNDRKLYSKQVGEFYETLLNRYPSIQCR